MSKSAVQIDPLRYLFLQTRERLIPESESMKTDLTKVFNEALESKIESGELINIALRGEVRTSKSTTAIELVRRINIMLERAGKNKHLIDHLSDYFFSDQTEFLRFIRSDISNVAILIDEFNRMSKTGLNSTTEEALFDYYSDVFAGKYIHRITCAPDVITDKNATIVLDIIGKDPKNRITRCKLLYRDVVSKQILCIGHVDISVKETIKNWEEHVLPIFFKQQKSEKDRRTIETWRQRDFYVRYQVKKYRRMELLEKHGVRDIREPEYATIILETLIEVEDLAKIGRVSVEIINTLVDEVRRRNKRIYSMLTLNEISQKVRAIAGVYTEINKMEKKLYKCKTPTEEMILKRTIQQLKEMLMKRIQEQEKLQSLYREYVSIS